MNIKFPEFIGRDIQLDEIKCHLAGWNQTVVVNIAGDGGVGKTALLGKLKEFYESQPKTLVTDIIDFSQTVHQVQSWVIEQIVKTPPDGFQSFHLKKQEIDRLEAAVRSYRERELIDTFVADYNLVAQNHRFVLLFDTFELVQQTPLLNFIIETVARLDNTALILAGRKNDDPDLALEKCLKDKFGPTRVLSFRLKGFTESEADLYFEMTSNLHQVKSIGKKIRKNIYILSEGRPIMIALALAWLDRGIPFMPEITRLNPEELQREQFADDLATLKTKFEYGLMDGIRKLDSPIDKIILHMAHLNKRFDQEMLQFFFFNELDDDRARIERKGILDQLQTLPFIKYISENYFVLHDEMIRLVQTHVWDSTEDPERTERRTLSVKADQYYDQKLKVFSSSTEPTDPVIYGSYQVEQIYYKLYADFEAGYYAFEKLFEELVRNQRPELASLAVNILREFKREPEYSDLLQTLVEGYYKGGVLLSLQKFEEAEKEIVTGSQRFSELVTNLNAAQALPLDRNLSNRLYKVYHQLGYCYRSLGDWQRAIDNYKQSLDLTLKLVEELDKTSSTAEDQKDLLAQVAETLNSLANVYRLVGDFDEARLLCQTSIFLRQTWVPKQVARSQYIMAMVLWEIGGTAEAMSYLRQAEKSCLPGDEITQALIQKQRAYIFFRTGLADRAVPLLHEAESVFRRLGQFSELADALIMLSRICREHPSAIKGELDNQDNMELARRYMDEAHQIADQIGDKFRLAECHLTKAFHYHKWSQSDPDRNQIYREEALLNWRKGVDLAQNRYARFLSHFSLVHGDIAFRAPTPDYDLAFKEYMNHCKLATHFKRAVYERAIDNLGDRLRELGQEAPVLTRGFIRDITDSWQQEVYFSKNYPEIIRELSEIKKLISERENLKQHKFGFNQAMSRGKWREAIEHCDSILEIASLYDDENRAIVLLDKFQAVHRLGDLSQARRLAKVVLQIGQDLKSPSLIGNAHLAIAQVLWDTTSTAEAAAHLDQAETAFRKINDELGLARVTRHRSYILFRAGIFDEPREKLLEVFKVFENQTTQESKSELADVLNVLSRINRTDPENPDYPQARKDAEQGLVYAMLSDDSYRIAECHLSLAILVFRDKNYQEVLRLTDEGLGWVSPEMDLLRSVYQGVRGAAFLQLGLVLKSPGPCPAWDLAFEAFIQELVNASKTKPAGMVRTISLLYGFFMDLPQEATQTYAQRVKQAWQQAQLDGAYPIVIRMCDEVMRYRPYIQVNSN